MRVLTVRQPWAGAIIHHGKSPENRSRNIAGSYRGPVAIHAGLQFDQDALEDPVLRTALPRDPAGAKTAFDQRHVVGAVIGVVDLVDAHWSGMECSRGMVPCHAYGLCSSWAQTYNHHLVLANPRPLATPIPAKGRLGLWRPDSDLEAAIREQVPA